MHLRSVIAVIAVVAVGTAAYGQQADEAASAVLESGNQQVIQVLGSGIPPEHIFAGTSLNGPGGNNDAFIIDPATDTATPLIAGLPVWGATFDNTTADRVLYTTEGGNDSAVDGAPLYAIPVDTGVPVLIGVIQDATGADFRIDGLATTGDTLYGSRAAASADGIYEIDMGTLVATLIIPTTDSISGIDADPDTGIIYGVNDTTLELVEIDPVGGTITTVAAYPDTANETDLDGLAVGGGRAYLIPDDNAPGLIYVYDFTSGSFVDPVTAPWGAVDDTFSGGAFVPGGPAGEIPESTPVPALGGIWTLLLIAGIGILGLALVARRTG